MQVHTVALHSTKDGGKKVNDIRQDDMYKLTTARQQLCRTRALKSLTHILHVKRERNKKAQRNQRPETKCFKFKIYRVRAVE